ncbi:IS30 family transposase, partial [Tamilnaduibacter salinus]
RDRRGRIRDRTCISERPEVVDRRDTIGHWEGDTIVGKRHSGAAITMVERASRFTCVSKMSNRKAASVRAALRRRFKPWCDRVETVTFDNGHEFAAHKLIEKDLGAKTYFAEPYSSWQRGTNENTNGLIRQYLPKARDLKTVTGSEIRMIENRLNNRPRKCLGYRTPHELFYNEEHELTVALRD